MDLEKLLAEWVEEYNRAARAKGLPLYSDSPPMASIRDIIDLHGVPRYLSREKQQEMRAEIFKKIAEAMNPLAEAAIRRRKQIAQWATKGNALRRKYSQADKARWRDVAASKSMKHITSKLRKAKLIATREGLPASAIDSIRKAI